ncbi:DUF6036 family nucleotidyltransferase [Bdellovibrionota bacterium FG-1]
MFLLRLVQTLDKHHVNYAIVGGYAVALHGAVRGTVDIDLVIHLEKKELLGIEDALHSLGLESRLPLRAENVFEFRREYIQNRNLLAWNFFNPKNPAETVDILLAEDLNQIKVKALKVGRVTLKVASVKDLIRMKTEAGRPQDIQDVAALKGLEP